MFSPSVNLNNMLPEATYLTSFETEQLNCSSVLNLARARFSNDLAEQDRSVHSYEMNKIKASLNFAYSALAGVAHLICNLFLLAVYGLVGVFDEDVEALFELQLSHVKCDGLAVIIGSVGTASPNTASEMFSEVMEDFFVDDYSFSKPVRINNHSSSSYPASSPFYPGSSASPFSAAPVFNSTLEEPGEWFDPRNINTDDNQYPEGYHVVELEDDQSN
jgi:hypothetical protein